MDIRPHPRRNQVGPHNDGAPSEEETSFSVVVDEDANDAEQGNGSTVVARLLEAESTTDRIAILAELNRYAEENDAKTLAVVKDGALKECTRILNSGNPKEQKLAAESIWIMSWNPEVKGRKEPGCIEGVLVLSYIMYGNTAAA